MARRIGKTTVSRGSKTIHVTRTIRGKKTEVSVGANLFKNSAGKRTLKTGTRRARAGRVGKGSMRETGGAVAGGKMGGRAVGMRTQKTGRQGNLTPKSQLKTQVRGVNLTSAKRKVAGKVKGIKTWSSAQQAGHYRRR